MAIPSASPYLCDSISKALTLAGGGLGNDIIYLDHVERERAHLFERSCELDLEGIVANGRTGTYGMDFMTN
jgi:hypothetical protein